MKFNDLKKDLRTLSGLLTRWNKGNVYNPNILNQLSFINQQGSINYEIAKTQALIFKNIDIENHSLPKGIEKERNRGTRDAQVLLMLNITEKEFKKETNDDRITKMSVNIHCKAILNSTEYKSSWHLDGHGKETDVRVVHPFYHLNFGGKYMTSDELSFGKLFLMSSPRIVHHPMDIILAIDFIIKNFYFVENHKSLTNDLAYKRILKNAGDRILKPYYLSLASYWNNSEGNNLNNTDLLPSLS